MHTQENRQFPLGDPSYNETRKPTSSLVTEQAICHCKEEYGFLLKSHLYFRNINTV